MHSEQQHDQSVGNAGHAVDVGEFLAHVEREFETWMDEKYHWDPDNPSNAAAAGLRDAKKCPPIPGSASTGPLDGTLYLHQLHLQSQHFLEERIRACRMIFDRLKNMVTNELKNGSGFLENGVLLDLTNELQGAINDHEGKQRDCDDYANKEKHINIIGNRPLDPKPRSPVIFVCLLIFVVVFEFVWVWFFLSGELGLSAAVNVSMAAATVVVLTAGLLAWSLAITEGDVEVRKRTMGYLGIALCVLVFLFGLGLLSAWRADSTNDGISYVIDGYRSIVEIDVFVTALVNLVGVIVLTHELKRFFWRYPLFYYGAKAKERDDAKEVEEGVIARLEQTLSVEKENLFRQNRKIRDRIDKLHKFGETAKFDLRDYARGLDAIVNQYVREYVRKNKDFRTNDIFGYPEPTWFEPALRENGGSSLNVCNKETDCRIEGLVGHIRAELGLTNDSDGTWKTRMESRLQEKAKKAQAQIDDARKALDGIVI